MGMPQPASFKSADRHPLQRLESPSKGFSGVLHVVGLLSFYWAFRFLMTNPNLINDSYGWHFQYLTIIGLSISTICFVSGLIADMSNSQLAFRLKNYLALTAAPIEVLISILYWGLRAIDTSLVIPPDLPMLPLFTDLAFHLFPALLLSIDTLLLSPPWPTSPINPNAPLITLSLSTVFVFLYWFWIELCYSKNGFYPYPIFTVLSFWQRVGLFMLSGITMWVVGTALRIMYAWVNGYEMEGIGMGKKNVYWYVDEIEKEKTIEEKEKKKGN